MNLLIPGFEYYAKANLSRCWPMTSSQGQGQELAGARPKPRPQIFALGQGLTLLVST